MTWNHANTDKDYRDYTLRLPWVEGMGGVLRLSFDLHAQSAYLCTRLDTADGDEVYDNEYEGGVDVPLAWANAIASGVDGFTLTPTEEAAS